MLCGFIKILDLLDLGFLDLLDLRFLDLLDLGFPVLSIVQLFPLDSKNNSILDWLGLSDQSLT